MKGGGDFQGEFRIVYYCIILEFYELGVNRWDRRFKGIFVLGPGVKVLKVSNL